MLRRRILASAMASVMAIGSVAVVANAEDAAVATKEAKTKDDLAAYVKSFDGFRSKDIFEFGSKSGEKFLDAIEYADNVLADGESDIEDYTVAYAMVEAVFNKLVKHDAEELANLIAQCKKDYETNNIMNPELGDNIWTASSFSAFEDAYDEAEGIVNTGDSRAITDAWEVLNDAHNNLSPLDIVKKSEFRTALQNYETALQKEYAYEAWRVGSTGHWSFNGKSVAYGTLYSLVAYIKDNVNAKYATLDAIKELNKTTQEDIVEAYKDCVAATEVLNAFKPDDTNRATKANVKSLLKEYNGRLVFNYSTTAAQDLYADIVKLVGDKNIHNKLGDKYSSSIDKKKPAVAKEDAWYCVKGSNGKLMSAEMTIKTDVKFYIGLDKDGYALGVSTANKLTTAQESFSFNDGTWDHTGLVYTLKEDYVVDSVVKATAGTEVICVDGKSVHIYDEFKAETEAGNFWQGWITNALSDVSVEKKMVTTGGVDGAVTYKLVSAGSTVDLTDYIPVYAADVKDEYSAVDNHKINDVIDEGYEFSGTSAWHTSNDFGGTITYSSGEVVETYTHLDQAIAIAYEYLAGNYAGSGIEDIDTIGQFINTTIKGSSAEWTLVHRYLKYALSDKYNGSNCNHVKKDVKDLIDLCYDLANKTGDAALFTYNHNILVKARQDALAWVKAAEKLKTYKDNIDGVDVVGTYINGDDLIADEVYHKLKGYYDTLMNEYLHFQLSFGDVAAKIVEVKDLIDDGTLTKTDALAAALEKTAYALSTVGSLEAKVNGVDQILSDNDAFTADRFFQPFNRVYTKDETFSYLKLSNGDDAMIYRNPSHTALKAAYDALVAEVKAQTEVKTVVGDLTGDGIVNALDAAAILKAVAAGTAIDVAVGDYNADGNVNALDAAAILKAVTQA